MRKKIDSLIIVLTFILGAWSIIMVLSATINNSAMNGLYMKQTTAFLLGVVIMFFMRKFPYKILEELSPFIYAISIVFLLLVLAVGIEINGSRRWLNLGFFYFQPVELAKISLILFLALVLEKSNSIFFTFLPAFVLLALTIIQPDAGSSLMFLPIWALMLASSRANTKWMFIAVPYVLVAAISVFSECYLNIKSHTIMQIPYIIWPISITVLFSAFFILAKKLIKLLDYRLMLAMIILFWISLGLGTYGSHLLKFYQKERIISFLVPELDPLGAGYNVRQSLLAVGSGRLLGKGLLNGTQTQLGFLPVRHNDFIFAIVAEELGFVGAIVMLSLFAVLLWQILKVAHRTEDYGGRMIAMGIFAIIFAQFILNIGVTLGLFPVMGIQLPFISYGGTGMLVFMAMIGIILNINRYTEIIGK